MILERIPLLRRVLVRFSPQAEGWDFAPRRQTQTQGQVEATVAVLDGAESRRYFGRPLANRSIQPVWVKLINHSPEALRLHVVAIDPNYYSPLEAAAANHFSNGRQILGSGALALLYLPLILLLPLRVFSAWLANQQMDDFFRAQAFHLRPIPPGGTAQGFVYTSLDSGSKVVHLRLLGGGEAPEFVFTVPVPGLRADYLRHDIDNRFPASELVACDLPTLQLRLAEMPLATSNRAGSRSGDPVNLAVIGEFPTIISAFGARWDETEVIDLATCWKTFRAFVTGQEYRYSPVSALYLFGRSQDFALQRIRASINERLHLRLWATPLRFEDQPVWVGQVSRDIGVRFTWRTWNLTTHRIDSDVDEARDYVLEDLLEAERLERAGYIQGKGACTPTAPHRNLTGDPYFTDGKIATMMVSQSRTAPKFVKWS